MELQNEVEQKLSGRMALASRAFLWVGAAVTIGVFSALAFSQRWFTPTVTLYFYTDTAAGLSKGMALKLAGFNVGSLDQVSLVGELRIRGKLVMEKRYRDSVGKDARIRLFKDGLLGSYELVIVPGPGDYGPVEEGSTLSFEREPDYGAMATVLLERTAPVIDNLRTLTAQLADTQAGMPKAVREIGEAAVALRDMGASVNALAADSSRLARQMPARLEPVLKAMENDLAQIEALTRQLNASVPAAVEDLRASLRSAREATEAARRLIAEDASRTLRRADDVLTDTDEILGAVRRSWPVKNMLPPPAEGPMELDSADGAGRPPSKAAAP